MTTPISSADTCGVTDARSTVPYPRTWADGEPADAVALNYEWKDTLNWLLGSTRPAFIGYTSATQTLSATQPQVLPMNTELLKRGGMVHSANDSRVFVPEEGWYSGSLATSLQNGSSLNRFSTLLLVNGVQAANHEHQYVISTSTYGGGVSFDVYIKAGSYVQLAIAGSYTTGAPRQTPVGGPNLDQNPRLEIFWSHRNS